MPDNLRSQIDGVFALFDAGGIQVLSREGYEADDIIGSITHRYENNGRQVIVISSDKDLCQFVRDGHVHIYDAMKRKFMKESDVLEKFWVPVHQVRDYLAIVGDASDNIPGISGFGPKKAQDLLQKFDTLEGIYDHLDELPEKMKMTLIEQKENAFLSQKLATIITDLHIGDLPDRSFVPGIETDDYIALLRQYEFRSLIPEGHLAPQKEAQKIDTIQIDTVDKLETLQEKIETDSPKKPIIISTDISGKIVIGYADDIYTVDSRAVDCSVFVTYLLESGIELVGYDLKTDIKRLVAIQKPLQNGIPEEQGRLF
jgi:DNA polymerase I